MTDRPRSISVIRLATADPARRQLVVGARSKVLRKVRGSASCRRKPTVDPHDRTANTQARVIEVPIRRAPGRACRARRTRPGGRSGRTNATRARLVLRASYVVSAEFRQQGEAPGAHSRGFPSPLFGAWSYWVMRSWPDRGRDIPKPKLILD